MLRRIPVVGPDQVAPVMVRLTTAQPSWRVQLAAPLSAVTVVVGLTLLLAPAIAPGNLFQLLLIPVLIAALGFGAPAALLAVAVAAALASVLLGPFGSTSVNDPRHLPALGLYLAEGVMISFMGAVVRAAIKVALRSEPGDTAEHISRPHAAHRPPVGPLSVERLTRRECEVLQLAATGRSVDELAGELRVSTNTVKTHLAHVYDKLGAHSRAEAVALAVHSGALHPDDLHAALEAGQVES